MTAVALAFDRIAEGYDRLYSTAAAEGEDEWVANDLAMIGASREPGPILDVGCGTGWLLDRMDIDPAHYTGLDVSEAMLLEAQRKHPRHRFITGDMHRIAALTTSVDAVFMGFDVLNLSPTPGFLLANIRDVLWPGGIVYALVTTPRHLGVPCPCHEYTPEGARMFYDEAAARALFEPYFHDVVVRNVQSPPPNTGSYFAVTARGRFYRDANDARPWYGPGGPPDDPRILELIDDGYGPDGELARAIRHLVGIPG